MLLAAMLLMNGFANPGSARDAPGTPRRDVIPDILFACARCAEISEKQEIATSCEDTPF